jgi:8-oxo-dGTP pyrophosphatase MutT (NUDIX family)
MSGKDEKIEKSAGVVILRVVEDLGLCVLLLKTYSKLDLPKGHVEDEDADDDDPKNVDKQILNAAKREAGEECGFQILDSSVDLDPSIPIARLLHSHETAIPCYNRDKKTGAIKKVVYLFAAETLCPDVVIQRNKETGIYEHQGFKWVPIDDVIGSSLHAYLQPGVLAAAKMFPTHVKIAEVITKLRKTV